MIPRSSSLSFPNLPGRDRKGSPVTPSPWTPLLSEPYKNRMANVCLKHQHYYSPLWSPGRLHHDGVPRHQIKLETTSENVRSSAVAVGWLQTSQCSLDISKTSEVEVLFSL